MLELPISQLEGAYFLCVVLLLQTETLIKDTNEMMDLRLTWSPPTTVRCSGIFPNSVSSPTTEHWRFTISYSGQY
jgi:hypothetical protein